MSGERIGRESTDGNGCTARPNLAQSNATCSFIHHLDPIVADKRAYRQLRESGLVVYCRVSGRAQDQNGNLDDQMANLQNWLDEFCIPVIGTYRDIASGWNPVRPKLLDAIRCARAHQVPILAESTDRFIRAADYTSVNWTAWPTDFEFQELQQLAVGVELVTLWNPEAAPSVIKRLQQERGQLSKGRRGGRPIKPNPGMLKRRRLEMLPKVIELRQSGWSLREIAKHFVMSHATIQSWLKGL